MVLMLDPKNTNPPCNPFHTGSPPQSLLARHLHCCCLGGPCPAVVTYVGEEGAMEYLRQRSASLCAGVSKSLDYADHGDRTASHETGPHLKPYSLRSEYGFKCGPVSCDAVRSP